MSIHLKQKDKEMTQIEQLIRETPVEVDLVDRVISKYERNEQPQIVKYPKKWHYKVAFATAMLACLLVITPFISPTMAATFKQVPVLSSIFRLAGDLGLQMADEKGLSTKPQASMTQEGFTLSVSEVAYDGTRVSIAIERPYKEDEKEALMDCISNYNLFINDEPINSFAPSESNSISPFMYSGKDNASAIIEFSDLRNQGGQPFPEQFDLTIQAFVRGIEDPIEIDIPVKNKVKDYVALAPNISRQYDNIHLTLEKVKLTPVTTSITTRMVLTDNSTFTGNLTLLTMGIDIIDEYGREIEVIGGNGWNATNGNIHLDDLRYTPFESVPKTITLKPYIHLFKENEKGMFQLDKNGYPKIRYIPELEITIPVQP
ncbi:DUF4179 domain-containing protein [Lysinibacillus sp. BSL11]